MIFDRPGSSLIIPETYLIFPTGMEALITAEDILNGPNFFKCDRQHARIKKSICIQYQRDGYRMSCQDCGQGKAIARELNISIVKMKKGRSWPYFGQPIIKKTEVKSMEDQKTKICSKCGLEKLLSEFFKHPYTKDGYEYRCKACKSMDMKKVRAKNKKLKKPELKDQVKEFRGMPMKTIFQLDYSPILEALQVLEDLFNKQIDAIKQAITQIEAINKIK